MPLHKFSPCFARGARTTALAFSIAAGTFAGFAPSFVPAQTTLSVVESRALAFDLLGRGQPAAAKAIADTLLQRDPDDVQAWLILSRAERLLRNIPAAKAAGKHAWRLAETSEHRFTAAMLTAQAVSASNNKIGAQLWLRRAAQAAPTDALKATAIRDLRYVRGTSPVSLRFDLSVAPSSNINNGSKSDTVEIAGFPFSLSGDAQALSGIEYSTGATLSYKLPTTGKWALTATTGLKSKFYTLSSEAKALAPNRSGSDYAFQEIDATLSGSRRDEGGPGLTTAYLRAGQNWYGGSTLTRLAGLGVGRQIKAGDRATLSFSLGAERQWRLDDDLRSADVFSLSTTWAQGLENGGAIWVTGYVSDTASDSAAVAQSTFGAALTYAHGKPIIVGTMLEMSLGLSQKNFDRALPLFGLREDRTITASATMIFNELDYYGFAPTAKLEARRTNSTLGQFDTDDLGLKIGLRSSF